MNEFDLIRKIKKMIPASIQGELGIGDDADFTDFRSSKVMACTDSISEGIDFVYGKTSPEMAGRKLLAINLSDMASMASTPAAYLVSIGIPAKVNERWILDFYRGVLGLAKKYKLKCLGGDFSRATSFWASLTLLGSVSTQTVTRSGARPGDFIGVTGKLGGSILGHHLSFKPRIEEAVFLSRSGLIHAMIDISDGFAQDLNHLLAMSGVGAQIDLDRLPVSSAARQLSKKSSLSALEHALSDGEDFELLFAASPRVKESIDKSWKKKFNKVPLTWVGRIIKEPRQCVWVRNGAPAAFHLTRKGFTHF